MDSLSLLAEKNRTDKGLWHHGYTPIYNKYFSPLRHSPISLLEIGIGGYEYPDKGGESLRMWAEYFPNGHIIGVDLNKKNIELPSNVTVYQGDQTEWDLWNELIEQEGCPDIIIDDGSHICSHIITTFELLFDKLNAGGIYVIEDTETSYWQDLYGGGNHEMTTMNYFKQLADCLNPESGMQNIGIESIHFYSGLIFIFKCP